MTDWIYDPARWPHLTADMPGTAGRIRVELDDFRVDEIPLGPPAGQGDHLLVHLEKRDQTTRRVLGHLREALGVDGEAIGHAGMKDRRAVTTQWITVPASSAEALAAVEHLEGVKILETHLHDRKLQEGDLLANRFVIRVREAAGQTERAKAIAARLVAAGVPNYYGPQRFGAEGNNAVRGLAMLKAGRKPRAWLDKLLTQAVQSWVFNDWLAARLAEGTFNTVLTGDIAVKHETQGKFLVGDAAVEAPRAATFAISATGPMLGKKYHESAGDARAVEDRVIAALGIERDLFRPLPGTRRPIRMPLAAVEVTPEDDGFTVTFELPSGGYATAVLGEIMKTEAAEADAD